MRKFIKYIIAVTAFAAVIIACTQSASAQFRYGPTLGVNLSRMHMSQDLVTVKTIPGITAGVQGELMFPGIGFGLGIGLNYNMLGAKVNLGEKPVWSNPTQGFGNERVMLHYVQIPLHLRFKWTRLNGIEDIIAPLVYAGPDFNILAAASNADAFNCKRLSMGMSIGFGVELFRSWQLTATYSTGMTDAVRTKLLDDFHGKTRNWSMRVTYFF